jgi:integrase
MHKGEQQNMSEHHEAEAVHKKMHSSGNHEKRAKRKAHTFTDLSLQRLKVPKVGQELHWDEPGRKGIGQLGLSVLLSSGGTKTFRASAYVNGRRIDKKLGRVGELSLTEARAMTAAYRDATKQGIDPRKPEAEQQAGQVETFAFVVEQFIERYAKPRQRTWQQTQGVLTKNCGPLMQRRMADITKRELYDLLEGDDFKGQPFKTKVTASWLRTLFRWAAKRDYVEASVMEAVEIEVERPERTRKDGSKPVYSDAEVAACWRAADQLPPVEGAYVKLLMLLAPRKSALAGMTRADLDDPNNPTEWTTPFELTKSRKSSTKKRTYITPLPPLAARILKGVLRPDSDLVFPGLPRTGDRFFGQALLRRLIKAGAPKDFGYHMWRHTIATFLQGKKHSEWERGLVLNHSSSGVTAGYSHGASTDLKRDLLTKWADHVEGLVRPEGAALLR